MNSLLIRKKNELSKKKKKGFTLIELIIVIAIIAILAAVALPKFGQIRENGNVRADIATAKNIQTAITTAVANGDMTLPSSSKKLTDTELQDVLDNEIPTPKASGNKSGKFEATLNTDGTVVVTANSVQIYPTPAGVYNLS